MVADTATSSPLIGSWSRWARPTLVHRSLPLLALSQHSALSLVSRMRSSLFMALTLAGSRLNGLIGSRSQMASIITSIIIILSIYFLLPYLYFLPKVSRLLSYVRSVQCSPFPDGAQRHHCACRLCQ